MDKCPNKFKHLGLPVAMRTRRNFVGLLAAAALLPWTARANADPHAPPATRPPKKEYPLFDEATANVIPTVGFQSRISLHDSMVRLVGNGVIDREKFAALQKYNGALPPELLKIMEKPSGKPIHLTSENAAHYVNFLWPVGLSNRLAANKESPMVGPDLPNFASTGGWNLGKEPNGGVYFNKFPIIKLKPKAEALAVRVAKSTYRPCCGNSTFFQDCNHGSALFAVLQLGAAQGLTEDQLYKEALAFNSFWFPSYYISTALYLKVGRKINWRDVDAKMIMGSDFSSGGLWQQNVLVPLQKFPHLFPQREGGAKCGA